MSFIMRPIRFAPTGYVIEGSGLFLGSDDYLQRTPASAGNRHVFTYATTLKRSELGAAQTIFDAGAASGDNFAFIFDANDKISLSDIGGARFVTTPAFRDTSSYYHIVLAVHSNGASGDTVPAMTGATSPSGTVTAEGQNDPSFAWRVFNNANSTNWLHANSVTSWLAYEFPSNTYPYITAYTIKARTGGLGQMPKTWTFQGWNGSSYVTLDTQTNASGWSNNEVRTYSLSSATSAYNKFRWNITLNQGDPHVGFEEAQIIGLNPFITPANQCKLYVNGTQITSFATNNISSMSGSQSPNNTVLQTVGRRGYGSANDYDGYIAQAIMIDGLQLTPSSFGETSDDGFWQINDPSELTFGTNGFLLEGGTNIAAGTDSNVTGYSPGSVVIVDAPFITRGADLTGNANGNTGLISLWVKFANDGTHMKFWGATTSNNEIQFYRRNDNTIWINFGDDGDTVDLFLKTSETVTVASGWTHLLVSWDVSAGYSDIYINDVQSSLSLDTTTSGGLDYTHTNHNFYANDAGGQRFIGETADYWLTVNNTRFELTTESNRRKFISSDGYAVDLGSDGSTPTGTAPLVFFHLDRGEAPANFFANAGTGGATTLSSGSLTEGSDPNGRHFTKTGTITATNDSPTNGSA